MHATKKEQEGNYRLGNLINQNPIYKVKLGTYMVSHQYLKNVQCSMLQQMQSQPNHTSYRNIHFNEFVPNALRDNIGSKSF